MDSKRADNITEPNLEFSESDEDGQQESTKEVEKSQSEEPEKKKENKDSKTASGKPGFSINPRTGQYYKTSDADRVRCRTSMKKKREAEKAIKKAASESKTKQSKTVKQSAGGANPASVNIDTLISDMKKHGIADSSSDSEEEEKPKSKKKPAKAKTTKKKKKQESSSESSSSDSESEPDSPPPKLRSLKQVQRGARFG